EAVTLVGKAYGEQDRFQTHEAEDPIAVAELAYVNCEHLADGEGQQHERLPAEERRTLEEADEQKHGSEKHEEGGVSELRVHTVIVDERIIAAVAQSTPVVMNFQANGDENECVDDQDGESSDGFP